MFINNRLILILCIGVPFFISSTLEYKDTQSSFYDFSTNRVTLQSQEGAISYNDDSYRETQEFIKKILLEVEDPLEWFYHEPVTQQLVESFLAKKTGNQEITNTVLLYTTKYKLPIKMVFSLVFVESSFSHKAVNFNSTSQDIGLFQLNTRTFRHLSEKDLLHLETNIKNGTEYLQFAFSLDSNPQIALAIYNAGPSRPLKGKTPESTKKYVKRIINYSNVLEQEFIAYVWNKLNLSNINQNEA